MNLLQLLPGGEVVFPWPSFSLYPMLCAVLGMTARQVSLTEESEIKPESLLSTVGPKTRAMILCNPNNPSGTHLSLDRVRELAAELPEDVLLIVDEAYVVFVDDPNYENSHALALETDNVVVARTFSKAHGLAGLRVGYGIAPERVADYAERVRFPVSVNLAAQVAATASMLAQDKVRGAGRLCYTGARPFAKSLRRRGVGFYSFTGQFRNGAVRGGRFRAFRGTGSGGRGARVSRGGAGLRSATRRRTTG